MNGTLKESKEKVAAKVGDHHLETNLSGYELEPNTKIIRDLIHRTLQGNSMLRL